MVIALSAQWEELRTSEVLLHTHQLVLNELLQHWALKVSPGNTGH